jgi:hypothetical protein
MIKRITTLLFQMFFWTMPSVFIQNLDDARAEEAQALEVEHHTTGYPTGKEESQSMQTSPEDLVRKFREKAKEEAKLAREKAKQEAKVLRDKELQEARDAESTETALEAAEEAAEEAREIEQEVEHETLSGSDEDVEDADEPEPAPEEEEELVMGDVQALQIEEPSDAEAQKSFKIIEAPNKNKDASIERPYIRVEKAQNDKEKTRGGAQTFKKEIVQEEETKITIEARKEAKKLTTQARKAAKDATDDSRDAAREAREAAREAAEAAEEAAKAAEEAAREAEEAAKEAAEEAQDAVGDATDAAQDAVSDAEDAASEAEDSSGIN